MSKGQGNRHDAKPNRSTPDSRSAESGTQRRDPVPDRQYSKVEPFVELRLRNRGRSVSRIIAARPKKLRSWFPPWEAERSAVADEGTAFPQIFEVYFALG